MRWRPGAITALLAAAFTAACGGGGGHDRVQITLRPSFPQGFLPALLTGPGNRGDLAFRLDGDLFAVTGTSDVTSVSRTDGTVKTFAHNVGGASTVLLSITPGTGTDSRLFAGDDAGRIWAIAADGSSATLLIDTGNDPITGLSFAPTGFGEFGGSLFATAGAAGVVRIAMTDPATVSPYLSNNGHVFTDLVFSSTTLYALEITDATHGQIDTVPTTAGGTPTKFQDGFVAPVGITVDVINADIYVADAVDGTHKGVLYTVPVAGGTPTKRGNYQFDVTAPSGISYDGIATIAFVTSDPLAVSGANLPRINPANTNFGQFFVGPNVGYGDLEFDRTGSYNLAADNDDDPDHPTVTQNFLFAVPRDGSAVTTLASNFGRSGPSGAGALVGEDMLGVAGDPVSQTIYVSSRLGDVFQRTSDGTVTRLLNVSGSPLLGLEMVPIERLDPGLPPFQFHPYGSMRDSSDPSKVNVSLVATTSDGQLFAIDVKSKTMTPIPLSLTDANSRLSDLVFAADGTLYVVENRATGSRILRVEPGGTAHDLHVPTAQLGQPDGIEIDEGGRRLLVTTIISNAGKLLAIDLDDPTKVKSLADISIDDGFFPTGVVYDRLGTAVFRQGNNVTSLKAVSVAP